MNVGGGRRGGCFLASLCASGPQQSCTCFVPWRVFWMLLGAVRVLRLIVCALQHPCLDLLIQEKLTLGAIEFPISTCLNPQVSSLRSCVPIPTFEYTHSNSVPDTMCPICCVAYVLLRRSSFNPQRSSEFSSCSGVPLKPRFPFFES